MISILPQDHSYRKRAIRYPVYNPKDITTLLAMMIFFIAITVSLCAEYLFLIVPTALLIIIFLGILFTGTATLSVDETSIYCHRLFRKKLTIQWSDIVCHGTFQRQVHMNKRIFYYFSIKPLVKTDFLHGADMPQITSTFFFASAHPALASVAVKHGMTNIR